MKTISKPILDLLPNPAIDSAFVILLDFTLPDTSHLRYARYSSDQTYDGNTYTAWPFKGTVMSGGKGHSVRTIALTIEDAVQTLRPYAIATNWFRNTTLTIVVVCVDELTEDYAWSTVTWNILHAIPQGEAITLKLGGTNPVKLAFPANGYCAYQCPFAKDFPNDPRCGYSGEESSCDGTLADCVARSNEARFGAFMGLDPDAALLILPAGLRGL